MGAMSTHSVFVLSDVQSRCLILMILQGQPSRHQDGWLALQSMIVIMHNRHSHGSHLWNPSLLHSLQLFYLPSIAGYGKAQKDRSG
ncbi:hypothetical protein AMATHDRAFT_66684 [Amanita thiersii Skay4041]|uniref:Uncharacterized protein n=1 Tax=Amanita thiersii Skay4041 TaxID=703135 RepID=A0A2A9NB41_9AGAR|nr:hypothetical protein AMATHDRAFT_66684 [Amanita thiersii Skay4041]